MVLSKFHYLRLTLFVQFEEQQIGQRSWKLQRSRNCVTKIPVFFFQLDCISSKCLCSSSFLSFLWKLNCPAKLFNHIKCGKIKQISNCLVFLVSYLHTLLAIEKYNVDKVFLITSRLFRKVAYTTIKWFSILSLEYNNPHIVSILIIRKYMLLTIITTINIFAILFMFLHQTHYGCNL